MASVARTSYGRLLALLAATDGDVPAAEDALAAAFEQALRRWPEDGVPANPDAWLLTVARNRRRDEWRSAAVRLRGTPNDLDTPHEAAVHFDAIDSDAIPDKRLALMLVCAHPALHPSVHMPLMLNTVLGFTADQIARACAVPTATLAARLVRAKRRIKEARIPFRIPDRSALPDRMSAVLECVYGTYAIDWHSGAQLRDSLTGEALYLAELLAELAPDVAEAHGLAALICMTTARLDARFDDEGRLIPLAEQDVARWNSELIDRGATYLRTAYALGMPGRFQLEAAIQAVHNARRVSGVTDWATLRELHLTLHDTAPTIGGSVALAAVTAEVDGPAAGLAFLDEIAGDTDRFQPAWSTRAHLLDALDRPGDAITAFDKAISLTTDPGQRDHLQRRREMLR